jgi:hypothetical protein
VLIRLAPLALARGVHQRVADTGMGLSWTPSGIGQRLADVSRLCWQVDRLNHHSHSPVLELMRGQWHPARRPLVCQSQAALWRQRPDPVVEVPALWHESSAVSNIPLDSGGVRC